MKSAEDVESYLLRMGVPHETVNPGMWLVKTDGPPIVISLAGPVVAFRMKVLEAPKTGREELFRTLLSLNTTEMVHGAYGLEADAVVIVHALEMENLDLNEFQAVIDDMSMAVAKHQPQLAQYVGSAATGAAARI